MKQARHTSAKRPHPAAVARKVATHKKRPLHRRILLHPFSVMVLLCAGVLVIGSTLQSQAASYNVTATVPASIPQNPAIIQQPAHQQYVTTKTVEVSGTCASQSYVKLYRNGLFGGVAVCDVDLTFRLQTNLSEGPNELNARIFNVTDQEGPASSPITVYYGQPVPPPAPSQELSVSGVESGDYKQGQIRQVSTSPTISGIAPPFSEVTVTFHSEVSICKTKADARGVWLCTLNKELEVGTHTVDIVAVTVEGKTLTFPTFQVRVVAGKQTVKQEQPVLVLSSEYQYRVYKAGEVITWDMAISGGTPPYKINVAWGDGATEEIAHPDQSVLNVSHAYDTPKDYVILVTATDAKGMTAMIQGVAIVKDDMAYAAFLSTHKGAFATILAGVRQWLWIVWPVYIAVVLMVLSYWIGEREGYRRIILGRRLPVGRGKSR